MLVCPVRTPQFLTYDSLDSEPSCQALLLVLYGVQDAKHTVHMLCGQNQSAMESHDATWASPIRSNRNLLPIWFRIKLGHWTFGNLSLLPNFSQPPHSGLWSGDSWPKMLSFKSSVCYFSHLFQRKCVRRVCPAILFPGKTTRKASYICSTLMKNFWNNDNQWFVEYTDVGLTGTEWWLCMNVCMSVGLCTWV